MTDDRSSSRSGANATNGEGRRYEPAALTVA
jgi:hypothetical protein